MNRLLTVTQAAHEMGRTTTSVRRAIRRGTLKAEKVGSVWIIIRDDLEEYLNNPPKPGPKKAAEESES
ncbi:MAG: helix-turn-helix domain-containing protein [Chloroflexota bacterium]